MDSLVCFGIIIMSCHPAGHAAHKPPVVVIHKGCPHLKQYTKEQQKQLAREKRGLDPHSIANAALNDYLSMRDQTRKCLGR
jgi:hypothetical protein